MNKYDIKCDDSICINTSDGYVIYLPKHIFINSFKTVENFLVDNTIVLPFTKFYIIMTYDVLFSKCADTEYFINDYIQMMSVINFLDMNTTSKFQPYLIIGEALNLNISKWEEFFIHNRLDKTNSLDILIGIYNYNDISDYYPIDCSSSIKIKDLHEYNPK